MLPVTGWSNSQLQSKVRRLRAIFGEGLEPDYFPGLLPDFGIVSPIRPSRIATREWPDWMKQEDGQPRWIYMPTPETLLKVTRSDVNGRKKRDGGYWKTETDGVSARPEVTIEQVPIDDLRPDPANPRRI